MPRVLQKKTPTTLSQKVNNYLHHNK